MYTLQLKNINKKFGDRVVLHNVDLQVSKGEVISIIGPSGAGKSTLLRCINFLEVPSQGDVIFEGKSIEYSVNRIGQLTLSSKYRLSEYRSEIGMVFQHFNLWKHKTVLENIIEGPIVVKKISKAEAIDKAENLLNKVGLYHKKDEHPSELSGGQQQRIAIARALAMDPRAMLFDEVTSALDPEMVGEVLKIMGDLARDGMTMLVVTHEMNFARQVSDRVIFMENGRIEVNDSPKNMFDDRKYERVTRFLTNMDVAR